MIKAVLTNGAEYAIPNSDTDFFKALAKRMGWRPYIKNDSVSLDEDKTQASWVDEFAGKWQDSRSATQIIKDIHNARTSNENLVL